jgi:hypothetical protein
MLVRYSSGISVLVTKAIQRYFAPMLLEKSCGITILMLQTPEELRTFAAGILQRDCNSKATEKPLQRDLISRVNGIL